MHLIIRPAQPGDEPIILQFIRGLAAYEKLAHECVATEADLTRSLFGAHPEAEVVIAYADSETAGTPRDADAVRSADAPGAAGTLRSADTPEAADTPRATAAGTPVGFALFFHNYSTFLARKGLYLEDLFVPPEHRGHGVGRALLTHLARIARERGCGRMEWSVLDWNESAIGFYRKIGAQAMDEWTVYRLTGPALEQLAEGTSP